MIATIFHSVYDKHPRAIMPLVDVLMSTKNRVRVENLRALPYRSEDYKRLKLTLPCWRLGRWSSSSANGMIEHGGGVVVEWDAVDDPTALKSQLANVPYIYFASLSCGGHGVFAIIKIAKPERHNAYYDALADYFCRYGFPRLDMQCRNLSRARLASYDATPIFNEAALIWSYELPKATFNPAPISQNDSDVQKRLFFAGLNYIVERHVDITSLRPTWLAIGNYIKSVFGDEGEEFFVLLSQFYPKFNERECRATFGSLHGTAGFGVFARACQQAQIPQLKTLI